MFTIQNINTLRSVLPTQEYKQVLGIEDQILTCLNNDLTCKNWDNIILTSRTFSQAKKRRMSIASACYELLLLAHEYRILRGSMQITKNELRMIKPKMKTKCKENTTTVNQEAKHIEKTHILIKSTICYKKEQLRKMKYDRETKMSLIHFLYYEILDMVSEHGAATIDKRI